MEVFGQFTAGLFIGLILRYTTDIVSAVTDWIVWKIRKNIANDTEETGN